MMQNMFTLKPAAIATAGSFNLSEDNILPPINYHESLVDAVLYLSDNWDKLGKDDMNNEDCSDDTAENSDYCAPTMSKSNNLPAVPSLKKHHLDIPYYTLHELK